LCKGVITDIANDVVMPILEGDLNDKIQTFSKKINGEGPDTWLYPLGKKFNDLSINMTMPSAPFSAKDSDLIKIYFDGLFTKADKKTVGSIAGI